MRRFSVLLLPLALTGCTTLNENPCITSDWGNIGYQDGINGTAAAELLKHQNECVKHDVIPDRDAYLIGWNHGVEQFCQPDNGFRLGREGGAYTNVCPEHLQKEFYTAYQDGRALHRVQSEINRLTGEISSKQQRLDEIATALLHAEIALISADVPAAERQTQLGRSKALAEERDALEADIQVLKMDIAARRERLSSMRNTLAVVNY